LVTKELGAKGFDEEREVGQASARLVLTSVVLKEVKS
jgi:hypothetical protein